MANSTDKQILPKFNNRWEAAGFIGILLAGAVGIASLFDGQAAEQEQRAQAQSKYITANQCVMAEMSGRAISRYRCDLPEQRYISGAQLAKEALAQFGAK